MFKIWLYAYARSLANRQPRYYNWARRQSCFCLQPHAMRPLCKNHWCKKKSFESVAENYESKTYKPLIENPCCYSSRRRFIYTFTNWGLTEKLSHQDGLRKFLGYRSLIQSFFVDQWAIWYVRLGYESKLQQPVRL